MSESACQEVNETIQRGQINRNLNQKMTDCLNLLKQTLKNQIAGNRKISSKNENMNNEWKDKGCNEEKRLTKVFVNNMWVYTNQPEKAQNIV